MAPDTTNESVGTGLTPQVSKAPTTVIEHCQSLRSLALAWESSILKLKSLPEFTNQPVEGANHGEAIANIMLAYRHIEDARMRLGKVIQAMDGGTSVYDKK